MASWDRRDRRRRLGARFGIGCLLFAFTCGGSLYCTGARIVGNASTLALRALPDSEIVLVRVLNAPDERTARAIAGTPIEGDVAGTIRNVRSHAGSVLAVTPRGLPQLKPRWGWTSAVEVQSGFDARGRSRTASFRATLVGREGEPWRILRLDP